MIRIFKRKIYDAIFLSLTLLSIFFLTTVFISEYTDNENLKSFIKFSGFFKKKLKNSNAGIVKSLSSSDTFDVWTLRLAQFDKSDFNLAKKEYKQYLNNGYRVYLKLIKSNYVLYLGPEIDKNKLKAYSKELAKKYNLSPVIEDYKVNVSVNDTEIVI